METLLCFRENIRSLRISLYHEGYQTRKCTKSISTPTKFPNPFLTTAIWKDPFQLEFCYLTNFIAAIPWSVTRNMRSDNRSLVQGCNRQQPPFTIWMYLQHIRHLSI